MSVYENQRRLLVRLRPYPDEALSGYLIRLCRANGIFGLQALHRDLLDIGDGDSRKGIAVGANLGCDVVESLIGPFPSYWGLPSNLRGLQLQDFNQRRIRWCPQCISEGAYLRARWTLKLSCICIRHHCWLQERCRSCGDFQVLSKTDFSRCGCGERLSVAGNTLSPTSIEGMSEAIEAAIFENKKIAYVASLEGHEWLILLRYLGQFSIGVEPKRPGQISNLHQLDIASQVVLQMATLLEDWPSNFHRLLEHMMHGRPNSTSLRTSFGRLYRVLYVNLQSQCFQFLRDAFEAYIHDSWWGLVCRRHRAFGKATTNTHPRLSFEQAAKRIGVSHKTVKRIADQSLCKVEQAITSAGRTYKTIHHSQLELIAGLAKSAMTLSEAAIALALPERRVRELIGKEVICPLVSRKTTNASRWLIPVDQLKPFSAIPGVSQKACVRIHDVLKYWRLQEGEFPAIVLLVLDGKIELSIADEGLPFGERRIDVQALKNWIQAQRKKVSEWLTVDHSAAVLGIKQQVAYELVRANVLPSVLHGKTRRVNRQALIDFRNNYVSLAELAKCANTSPKKLLQKILVVPICGPSIDGTRQYFYRRADISINN